MEAVQDLVNDDNADPALAEAKRLWMESPSDTMNLASNSYVEPKLTRCWPDGTSSGPSMV